MIEKYGFKFPDGTTDVTMELKAFGQGPRENRYEHCCNIIDMLWGHIWQWNPWAEDALREMCDNGRTDLPENKRTQYLTITGPGASSKTTCAGVYALLYWLSRPMSTGVIVTSTTLDGLKKRIWKEIIHYWSNAAVKDPKKRGAYKRVNLPGNLVQSATQLQAVKGSVAHGIFGVAVDQGNMQKALGRIIGYHPSRLLIVVDEMTDTSPAIVEACTNLEATEDEFQFIGVGNALSRFDPHGKMSEPVDGWASITVEDERWNTQEGVCLHMDGLKSPNVILGQNKWPFLLKQSDIDKTIAKYTEDSPQFWRMRRGFWAPDGISKTVLSEPLLIKFNCKAPVIWQTGFGQVAGLDPAFEGGDRCVLRFARYGKDNRGKMVTEFYKKLVLAADPASNEPLHYQLARKTLEACREENIGPSSFAMDSTGEGGGLLSIIAKEWGALPMQITAVEFGGKASSRMVEDADKWKPAEEMYVNRVSELWYQFRTYVMADQIRGLDDETAQEFCMREYELTGTPARVKVEPKTKMKERTNGMSPDNADAAVVVTELLAQKGVFGAFSLNEAASSDSPALRDYDADSWGDNYGAAA